MKHLLYIIIGLAAVASLYFVYVNREQLPPNQRIQPSANITPDEWETKSDEQPPVTVMVTPIEFGKNIEVWKFDIAFDTHSGSLDDDLLKVAALIDDGGNLYKPIAWEGPGPGGHHREGILSFNAINPTPKYVELKIKDVGGITERSFK